MLGMLAAASVLADAKGAAHAAFEFAISIERASKRVGAALQFERQSLHELAVRDLHALVADVPTQRVFVGRDEQAADLLFARIAQGAKQDTYVHVRGKVSLELE